MLDKKEFEEIKQELDRRDSQRESMIKDSRDVLKLSKLLIYSLHREDHEKAKELAEKIKKEMGKLKDMAGCEHIGSYKAAAQEYVEALCFYEFVINKKILSCKELGVDCEHYLLGLCDLSGELVRLAVNSGIKGDYDKVSEIKDFVEELYGAMLEFDFRNGELRKKFDNIKWDLNKIENLVYEINLKRK